jgi:hypothetical protein
MEEVLIRLRNQGPRKGRRAAGSGKKGSLQGFKRGGIGMFSKNTTLWGGISLIILFVVVAGIVASCGDESEIASSSSGGDIDEGLLSENQFLKQNVAFADARVRSISETACVKEIVLIDFSKSGRLPSSMIFDGTTFFDDGSYNDLQASDGIYASAAIFNHSERVPYDKELPVRSVMEQIVIDADFQFKDRMEYIAAVYSMPINMREPRKAEGDLSFIRIKVICDLEFGTCGCRADRWGLCSCCCFYVGNCHSVIEFGV